MNTQAQIKGREKGRAKSLRMAFLALAACIVLVPAGNKSANAFYYCYYCICAFTDNMATQLLVITDHTILQTVSIGMAVPVPFGVGGFGSLQMLMSNTLLNNQALRALQKMAQQMSVTIMQEAAAVGGFVDASAQIDTQTTIQRLSARAYKDYNPSVGMCTFGTNARSLAESDHLGQTTAAILNRYQMARMQNLENSNASEGPAIDRAGRLEQFAKKFCFKYDQNAISGKTDTGLHALCDTAAPVAEMNRDTDYMRTVLQARTIGVSDFTDTAENNDEQAILALASNLYSHRVFPSLTKSVILNPANHSEILDMRSVLAQHNVAQASFNTIVGMKAAGTAGTMSSSGGGGGNSIDTGGYMKVILSELGLSANDAEAYIGSKRPSYLAQLEILAKKIYQRPEFYTELYESPANVKRRGVAMQAIGLMLNRDIYESQMRSEAILSTLLEMDVNDAQDVVQTSLDRMTENRQ